MKSTAILLAVITLVAQNLIPVGRAVVLAQGEVKQKPGAPSPVVQPAPVAAPAKAKEHPKQVSMKIEPGTRISLRNRFGPITVTGWSRDTLEATATSQRSPVGYEFGLNTQPSKDKILLTTAVNFGGADKEKQEKEKQEKEKKETVRSVRSQSPSVSQTQSPSRTDSPSKPKPGTETESRSDTNTQSQTTTETRRTPRPVRQPRPPQPRPPTSFEDSLRGVSEIRLEIKVPQGTLIELVDSRRFAILKSDAPPTYLTNTRNDVTITNLEVPVSVISSGNVRIMKVGAAKVSTRAGNVDLREVAGAVNVSTVLGTITVRETGGDVRAVSISGAITIECALGRVEANTTNGVIRLGNIGGDVDASTTGGEVLLLGPIRDGGRYRLRSMSGVVRMMIQPAPPGFVASMSSYQGRIVTDFELKTELSANTPASDLPVATDQPVRRVGGTYGEGGARITLDSFSGMVQLGRAQPSDLKQCR